MAGSYEEPEYSKSLDVANWALAVALPLAIIVIAACCLLT